MSHNSFQDPEYINPLVDSEGMLTGSWERWFFALTSIQRELRVMDVDDVDPVSVAANTSEEQTIAVPEAEVGDIVIKICKPTLTAGIAIVDGRVDTDGSVEVQFLNTTGSAIDPPKEDYKFIVLKG